MMGGKRCGWGLPPLYEGASTASLSARATSCPFTLSVFLGEGPEQARGVRDRRCEVGIRGAGHSPYSCNSAGVGEEGSPFVQADTGEITAALLSPRTSPSCPP